MTDGQDLEALWSRMRASGISNWDDVRPRLSERCDPVINARFKVPANSTVFTIGSCFARNIEENLAKLGFDLPMLALQLPANEKVNSRAANIVNKYTPPAIWQELKWCANILRRDGIVTLEDCRDLYYDVDGLCFDNVAHTRFPVTPERMVERRQHIFDVFRHVFDSDCVVITLGFTECFYDRTRDHYVTNGILTNDALRASLSGDVEFQSLSFEQAHGFIRKSLDLIWELNPVCKVLLTVSPVPLKATFLPEDVILATAQTKALLRTVAGEVVGTDPRVGYFPGFERVMLTRSWDVFRNDLRHVSDFVVKDIVAQLTQTYFDADAAHRTRFEDKIKTAQASETQFNVHLLAAQTALEDQELEVAKAEATQALEQAILNPDINNGQLKAWRVLDAVATAKNDWKARDTALSHMAQLRPHCSSWIKLAYNNFRLKRFEMMQSNIDMAVKTIPLDHPNAQGHIDKLSKLLAANTPDA